MSATPEGVVGSDRSIAAIVEELRGGRSVVAAGILGSGKTHLVEAVLRDIPADDPAPVLIRAAASLSSTPYGALRSSTRAERLLEVRGDRTAGSAAAILVIDDAHLLDVESAQWLSREVHTGHITTLVVTAPSSSVEARRARPETLTELDELWISGHARRIDLRPLTFAEAEELIEQQVGPAVVDRLRRVELFAASGGSRLFLVEMVREVAADRPRHGRVPSTTRVPITTRIRDVLRYQLSDLSRPERVCLALVSRLGGIARSRLARVLDARSVDRLVENGHLSLDRRLPDMVAASPLFSAFCGFTAEIEEVDRLVDLLSEILPREAAVSVAEASELAMRWSFDDRLSAADERHGTGVVRRILLLASAAAVEQGRFGDALTAARMADSLGPSSDARIAVSRALSGLRHDDEAVEVLETAVPLLSRDAEGSRLFQWWSALLIGLAQYDDLAALSTEASTWPAAGPLLHSEIEAARLQTAYAFMRWDEVAPRGRAIAADTGAALQTRVRAAVEAATAFAYSGDVPEAFRCLDLARRINTDPVSGDTIEDIAHVTILSGEALLRFTLGIGFTGLLDDLEALITRSIGRHGSAALGFLGYVGAVADLFRGDLRSADLEYRAAVSRFTTVDSSGWRSGVHAEHALVLALLGETTAATAALRQAEDLSAERSPLTRHFYLRARVVVEAQHEGADTSALARALLDLSAGSPALHIVDLYLVLLFGGGTAEDSRTLQRVTAEFDEPLGRLIGRHLAAREADDPVALERVGADFAELGAYLLAFQAQDEAVRSYERTGNALHVSRARRRLATFGLMSRRPRTDDAVDAATRLSERERQVAVLAADGLSNREIADRLFLSVRTVESHVYQARVKLGADSRRTLRDVLDTAG